MEMPQPLSLGWMMISLFRCFSIRTLSAACSAFDRLFGTLLWTVPSSSPLIPCRKDSISFEFYKHLFNSKHTSTCLHTGWPTQINHSTPFCKFSTCTPCIKYLIGCWLDLHFLCLNKLRQYFWPQGWSVVLNLLNGECIWIKIHLTGTPCDVLQAHVTILFNNPVDQVTMLRDFSLDKVLLEGILSRPKWRTMANCVD